jgi:Hsp20/alpha crystallin family
MQSIYTGFATQRLLGDGQLKRGKLCYELFVERRLPSTRFRLSSKIDQNNIKAEMKDGVLSLVLQKAEETKPLIISVT